MDLIKSRHFGTKPNNIFSKVDIRVPILRGHWYFRRVSWFGISPENSQKQVAHDEIKELPEKFESAVAEIASLLLSHYKDTRGIIVIGSVADGTYNKTSDIDLVWIKSRPLDYKKQFRIEEDLERISDRKIQLVPFSTKQIRCDWRQGIKKGGLRRPGDGSLRLLRKRNL